MLPSKLSKRTDFIRGFALSRNLAFEPSDSFSMIRYLDNFKLSRKGSSRKAFNIVTEVESLGDWQFHCFDLRLTYHTGKSTYYKDQSVFLCSSTRLGIPPFHLQPEHIFHKIGSLFGYKDIDFEAYPAFSDSYFLKSKDEDLVRDFFSDEIVHFFSKANRWHCEGNNFFFILYRDQILPDAEQYPSFWNQGKELFRLFRENTSELTLYPEELT
jgi:hypothetical protein